MAYAERTTVSSEKSKEELRKIIYKNEGSNFRIAEEDTKALLMFSLHDRIIRFIISFPSTSDFMKPPKRGARRSKNSAEAAYEQERRRRWRSLILAIKAKFELVNGGIMSFEEEFLPYILLPSGETVAEAALTQIADAYSTGNIKPIKLIP
jgi:hypothetical protein